MDTKRDILKLSPKDRLNWDLQIRRLVDRCIKDKRRVFARLMFLYLLYLNYNFFLAALIVAGKPVSSHFRSSITEMFVHLADYTNFDTFFFAAGGYTVLFTLFLWIDLLQKNVETTQFFLEFAQNLLEYRQALPPAQSVREAMLADGFPPSFPFAFYQLYKLKSKQEPILNVKKFRKKQDCLRVLSLDTRLYVAIYSDTLCLLWNSQICLWILALIYFHIYMYIVFQHTFEILFIYGIYSFILFTQLEFISSPILEQTIAFGRQLDKANALFKNAFKNMRMCAQHFPSRKQTVSHYGEVRLRAFWHIHTSTSRQVDVTNRSWTVCLWYYWLLPVNAYLLYRLFFVPSDYLYRIFTFLFLLVSTLGLLLPSYLLTPIHAKFNEHRERLSEIVWRLAIRRGMKIKGLIFFEHLLAEKSASGFKIQPDLIVNYRTISEVSHLLISLIYLI